MSLITEKKLASNRWIDFANELPRKHVCFNQNERTTNRQTERSNAWLSWLDKNTLTSPSSNVRSVLIYTANASNHAVITLPIMLYVNDRLFFASNALSLPLALCESQTNKRKRIQACRRSNDPYRSIIPFTCMQNASRGSVCMAYANGNVVYVFQSYRWSHMQHSSSYRKICRFNEESKRKKEWKKAEKSIEKDCLFVGQISEEKSADLFDHKISKNCVIQLAVPDLYAFVHFGSLFCSLI